MPQQDSVAAPLLAWFRQNQRVLPFRTHSTPYRVWVSEIMLQQTRVSAVLPYYERFMAELPTVADLAACPPQRLDKLWEGLGYYSRARNLQKAARIVCEQYGGELPASFEALRALPGVGDYTAGAIASICFGLPVPAVDGNVLRVFSRLYADEGDVTTPAVKRAFTARVMAHQPPGAPGDYNQALMELGALVCLPGGEPLCGACPLGDVCEARRQGRQTSLPVKPPKKPRRAQAVSVALVHSPAGWLVQRRPGRGLLAGLWQPVLWEQAMAGPEQRAALQALLGANAPAPAAALPPARHIFSHIEWQMSGWRYELAAAPAPPAGCAWAHAGALRGTYTLPGAFKAYRALMLAENG